MHPFKTVDDTSAEWGDQGTLLTETWTQTNAEGDMTKARYDQSTLLYERCSAFRDLGGADNTHRRTCAQSAGHR